jgi:RNA polymerase sigma factor (TIGR02999 family)
VAYSIDRDWCILLSSGKAIAVRRAVQGPEHLTDLLNAAQSGDRDASQKAYELVYAELKRTARNSLRRAFSAETLTPTALVHEVYLRFNGTGAKPVRDRAHFYALAARAMRQILVDHARRRGAGKRGGGAHVTDLDRALTLDAGDSLRALELDAALRALEACDSELAQLVEWHFFAGLGFEEIAKETHRHKRTVFSHWELARAFLQRELGAAVS